MTFEFDDPETHKVTVGGPERHLWLCEDCNHVYVTATPYECPECDDL